MGSGHDKDKGKAPAGAVHPPLDVATLRAVCRRESEAMNQFFDYYYDRVYGHVVHLMRDAHQAEDLTQEAFIRLSRVVDRLDPERDPTPWVFTVVTNCVRDHWRSRQHKQDQRRVSMENGDVGNLANGKDGIEAHLERQDEQSAIERALQELSEADRQVILLRNYEELDTAAIAAILEATPEAIRQRHSRAVGRLAKAYTKYTDTERNG